MTFMAGILSKKNNWQDEEDSNEKYHFFKAWKWFIILFEATFIIEIAITIIYWTHYIVLKEACKNENTK